jgi:hypothetical protein
LAGFLKVSYIAQILEENIKVGGNMYMEEKQILTT